MFSIEESDINKGRSDQVRIHIGSRSSVFKITLLQVLSDDWYSDGASSASVSPGEFIV